jgi:hypothetical protein
LRGSISPGLFFLALDVKFAGFFPLLLNERLLFFILR